MRSQLHKLLLLVVVLLSACGTVPIQQALNAYGQGEYEQATAILSSDEIRRKDRLLALMEKGAIQHEHGDYLHSSQTFLEASALLKSTDFVSLTEKASSLTTNDWAATYRGESAERLWIHTYQMMNFLLLNKPESAAVEARQAISLLNQHEDELQEDYFTRALLATSFDAVGLHNDAYIEYRKLAELLPGHATAVALRDDRARKSGIPVDSPVLTAEQREVAAQQGMLVLFVATGSVPRKIPSDIIVHPSQRISFPIYAANVFRKPELRISIDSPVDQLAALPQPVNPDNQAISTNLGNVARKALAARGARIAAQHIVRSGVKHALVDAAKDQSSSAAALLDFAFFILEQADTRGWVTLPAHLQLLRVPLPSGSHSVSIWSTGNHPSSNSAGKKGNDQDNRTVHANAGPAYHLDDIVISPGRTIYKKVRLY